MERTRKVLNEILQPGEEFTPIPFWFFNDRPEEGKLRSQLEDYVAKGVNGIVLHPRIGVPKELPYLSEEYFGAVRFIVKTAAELGMKIVLYDEGMYPSGSAHGMVVAQNPDYASKGICLLTEEEAERRGGEVVARLSDGRCIVYGFTGGNIRGIHFGEDDGEPGAPKSADILNPDAVDLFIRLTHDRYYEELKEYFGSTIIGFFTDEPCALGRNAGKYREWVPGMEEEIAREGGNMEELAELFSVKQGGYIRPDTFMKINATTEIYHKLVKKHLRENFYAKLSCWCEDHGIALMGHPAESDDIEEELYFQIPGQDLIMRRVSPETGGVREFDSVQAKVSADIARHLGRRRNANECFGVCNRKGAAGREIPWYFTGRDMKWYINWLGFRGVNLFVPHAFYYSVAGERKGERPPDVGPNNIWWAHYRQVSDYIKRISYLMTDSVNSARVAVLCDNNRVPYEEVAELYERQVEFNYLPVALLPGGSPQTGKMSPGKGQCAVFRDGKVCIRDYAYDTVLNVVDRRLDAVLEEGGVRVVHSARELQDRTVESTSQCPGLRASRLVKDGVEMYLLSNEGEEQLRTGLRLPLEQGTRVAEVDLWKGSYTCGELREKMEAGAYPLTLKPCEMRLLIVDREGRIPGKKAAETQFMGDWTGEFQVAAQEENRITYRRSYTPDQVKGGEYFTVEGEEMAECYCNGTFVGASLYGPHEFSLGEYLHAGENEVELVFTGSAANLYEGAGIPFGLAR